MRPFMRGIVCGTGADAKRRPPTPTGLSRPPRAPPPPFACAGARVLSGRGRGGGGGGRPRRPRGDPRRGGPGKLSSPAANAPPSRRQRRLTRSPHKDEDLVRGHVSSLESHL